MRSLVLILSLLLLLNAGLLTEIALYSRNTFAHHPEWFNGKMLMERQPISIFDCLRTRNLTARNRLNLAAWHGMQEALVNRVVDLERVNFRYRLTDRAYLVVIASMTAEGFCGVLVSRYEGLPSAFFRADPSGRFRETRPLAGPGGPGWHQVELRRSRRGLQVSFDGSPPATWETPTSPGLFGFRGSFAHVEVDDVELWEGGRVTLRDNFRNDRQATAVGLHCLGLLLLGTLLLALGVSRQGRRGLMWLILGQFLLGVFLAMYFLVDYCIWSDRYNELEPPEKFRVWLASSLDGVDPVGFGYPDHRVLEFMQSRQPPKSHYRVQIYRDGQTFRLPDTAQAIRDYRAEHPATYPCVLVLGASQAGGEGAARITDTMLWQLHRRLGRGEVVNACLQGSDSSSLVARYMTHLRLLKPDLVVAYHGSNDTDPELLAANLQRLNADCRRCGAGLLLVLEANSPENPSHFPPHLEKKLAAMRTVAQQLKLPTLDLQASLSRPELVKGGLLWWDAVHPTSYGHLLAGEQLAQAIEPLLRPPGASSP